MHKVIRHINVVDVETGVIKERVNVFIEGSTIANIALEENIPDLDRWEVIDLEGCFLTPGLIDVHAHLIWSGGEDPVRTVDEEGIQVSLLRAAFNARETLEAGITTIRDLGSNENAAIAVARAIDRGYIVGPRVFASGCTIIMTGGHDPFWGVQVDGEIEAMKAVRKQISAGAKLIKVSATGGVYGRLEGEGVGTAELTEKELNAICEEAHRFGLKVAAHAISEEGIWNCIKAGIDTIEHGHFLTDSAMDEMVQKGTYWVPTLFVYRQIANGENIPPYARKKAQEIIGVHRDAFNKALTKGVPLAAGSDAGSPNTPHTSLLNELESMVDYGGTPLAALKAATHSGARALGMECHLGSIEVGKKADLLVVSGNPLDNITKLRDVVLVMKDGETVRLVR